MMVNIIGGHGGVAPGFRATSYLIDGTLLIDAGSCATGLLIEEQIKIDHILISHPHLDHIKDLAFICDNCFGLKDKPFEVYTNITVESAIKEHIMNELIWPDFSKLPNEENPTLRFHTIETFNKFQLGEYTIQAVPVNHPGNGMGFIIEKGNVALLFTQDTAATDHIWKEAKKYNNIKGIFTEVSFPNSLEAVAIASQHHTPQSLSAEIPKMPADIPIFLGHLKPNYQSKLYEEIKEIGNDRITLLGNDNTNFVF